MLIEYRSKLLKLYSPVLQYERMYVFWNELSDFYGFIYYNHFENVSIYLFDSRPSFGYIPQSFDYRLQLIWNEYLFVYTSVGYKVYVIAQLTNHSADVK